MGSSKAVVPYFAYGSNLLADRIHVNISSAKRIAIGKLNNYRLDFITFARSWNGATATIVPKKGTHVWGAVWEIDQEEVKNLDRQEGVHSNVYFPLEVKVVLVDGKIKVCRTYQQSATPEDVTLQDIPEERRPSPEYLRTIIRGAEESGLPDEYVAQLRTIPDNKYNSGDQG